MGKALMGTGIATGENRAIDAAQKAISSPLLDDSSVDGARGLLINVTGGSDLTLHEVSEAAELIQDSAHDDAHIIFGAVIDNNLDNEMRVTVIATGYEQVIETPVAAPKAVVHQLMNHKEKKEETKIEDPKETEESLKNLANLIKGDTTVNSSFTTSVDFDIPTFLRKHAD